MSIEVRAAVSDADLEAWARVKRAVLPNESAWTVQQFRERSDPDTLVLVADLDGEIGGRRPGRALRRPGPWVRGAASASGCAATRSRDGSPL